MHRTFLLTWNPLVYAWRDLRRDVARVRRAGRLDTDWSCARSKQIRKGDRVFLIRQVVPAFDLGLWWPTVAIGVGILLVIVALLPPRHSS